MFLFTHTCDKVDLSIARLEVSKMDSPFTELSVPSGHPSQVCNT